MPIYEYECGECGHQLETMQKFSDAPLKECPECHKPTLQKQISSTSFQLKGTGWYVTDIRDKGKPKPADKPSDSGEGSKTPEAKETKEIKPATTTDTTSTSTDTSSKK